GRVTVRVAVSVTVVLASAFVPFAADAATSSIVDVYPGDGSLAAALAQARPGDTLLLHTGTFSGAITVSTAGLTIEPAGDGPVTTDGACTSIAAVNISADGLTLNGPMTVTGGHIYELDYLGPETGAVDGLSLVPGDCRGSVGIFLQRVGAVSVTATSAVGF